MTETRQKSKRSSFRLSADSPVVREAVLKRWRDKVAQGQRLVGVGVDAGFTAAAADRAGVDFMVVNNMGKFRRAGVGMVASLMPYDDANSTVITLAKEVLPAVRRTPVLAGLCGVDPFRISSRLLDSAANSGYAGVQNFPSVGFIDGAFRRQMERAALGFELEVEMMRLARESGLLGVALAFSREEVLGMARAGADVIICHRGLDVPGEAPADAAECLRIYRERMMPALDLRADLLLMVQGAGSEADATFLNMLGGDSVCHGIFYDYAMDWPGIDAGTLMPREGV